MINRLINTLEKYDMIHAGDTVIVALSGGADSVSLLFTLYLLKDKLGFDLKAAHLNHNLRGDESLRDEKFCRNYCKKLGIDIFVKSVNIKEIAISEKISVETAGRRERYGFFDEISCEYKNSKIATAHTASDNLETVLFNLVRGTGIDGLCGIPVKRGNIIRPLIETTREDIERFCLENSLDFVTDSTNSQLLYTRNKIRAMVVPVLKELNPSVENAAVRMSAQISEISDFLDKQAEHELLNCKTGYGYSCEKMLYLESALTEKMIFLLAKKSGINNLEKKHIDLCVKTLYNGGKVALPGGHFAVAKQGIFRIIRGKSDVMLEKISLNQDFELDFANKHYSFSFIDDPGNQSKNLIPLESVKGISLRTRRGGDVFRPKGRGISKSLKKLLNEKKIPCELRDSLLLIEQNGNILWLEGVGNSALCMSEGKIIKSFLKITINHHINDLL